MTRRAVVLPERIERAIRGEPREVAQQGRDRHVTVVEQCPPDALVAEVLGLRGGTSLLDSDPTLQRSIRLRNPYVDPMNVLQVDLLRRWLLAGTRAGRDLATANWPGALTLVVRPKVVMADWVGDRQRRTLGVRVPDHPVPDVLHHPGAARQRFLHGRDKALDQVECLLIKRAMARFDGNVSRAAKTALSRP